MPLRALLDGTDVVAPLLGAGEWEALREEVRRGRRMLLLPCCNASAYGRTSPRGLQHFVHPPQSTCERRGETVEHLLAKYELVQACQESGYDAAPEWDEGPWRADVLARKGSVRVAFEVQWTRQSLAEMLERQERYRQSGVRGCWLCREAPEELHRSGLNDIVARYDLPLFEMAWNGSDFSVILSGRRCRLQDFVRALLGGDIAFRETATVVERSSIEVALYQCRCWRCAGDVVVYRLLHRRYNAVTACGVRLEWMVRRPEVEAGEIEPEFHPRIRAMMREAVQSDAGHGGRFSMVSRMRGQASEARRMMAFACPDCGATFRKLDLRRRPARVMNLPLEHGRTIDLPWPHWCHSAER